MPIQPKVEVEGLKGFRRELKALGEGLEKDLQKVNKYVVNEIVVPDARSRAQQPRVNLRGNPTRLGSKGTATIRGTASQTRAEIAMGGARAPWAGGHEWGSGGKYPQFPARTADGYILRPAALDNRDRIKEAYADEIQKLARRAFPEPD